MKNENEAADKASHLLPTIMQMGVSFTWRVLTDYGLDRYFQRAVAVQTLFRSQLLHQNSNVLLYARREFVILCAAFGNII